MSFMALSHYTEGELIHLIGCQPGNDVHITNENRAAIQCWLTKQGIDETRVTAMRDATLFKAYSKPQYLRAILTRGDYAPAVKRDPAQTHYNCNGCGQPVLLGQVCQPCFEKAKATPFRKQLEDSLRETETPTPAAPASNGHDKGAQLAALIQSLASGAVDESRVIALIKQHAPKPDERIVERIVLVPGELEKRELPDQPRHCLFPQIMAAVAANIPVMLVGPAGAGKTTLGHQIAEALGLSFAHTGAVSSRYELSGYNDAHGNYQPTAFRQAYENGGLFLFDEIDASDPAALLWCNTAIANGVCAFPDGNIQRHENFRLIAAANTFGRGADRVYVGRNALDGASLDRFVVFEFDYDEQLERAVFGDNDWTAFVQKVRRAVATLKLRHVVTPRATDYGQRLIKAGLDRATVEQATVWKGLEPDQIAKIRAAL